MEDEPRHRFSYRENLKFPYWTQKLKTNYFIVVYHHTLLTNQVMTNIKKKTLKNCETTQKYKGQSR